MRKVSASMPCLSQYSRAICSPNSFVQAYKLATDVNHAANPQSSSGFKDVISGCRIDGKHGLGIGVHPFLTPLGFREICFSGGAMIPAGGDGHVNNGIRPLKCLEGLVEIREVAACAWHPLKLAIPDVG